LSQGWKKVFETADYVATRFHDGDCKQFEELARFESPDLVTLFEIESWNLRVGDRTEVEPSELRVTTTFRREDDTWKIVHRHADPIRTFDAEGPLRSS